MNMDLVGRAFELFRKIFDPRLDKEHISESALSGLPRRLHRDLHERGAVGVDPYVEFSRVFAGSTVYKAAVPGPYVHHHPFAGMER
jgi:hypothetical protein